MRIRIGTRESNLALIQTNIVKSLLLELNPDYKIEIVKIKTSGDKNLEQNLYEIGGKGLFIKELEESLLSDDIDIAVHSLKDMPAIIHEELELPCVLERADYRDALISTRYKNIENLPKNAIIGTSSPRRAAQLLNIRPDVKIVKFRGNIQTRLKKLEAGQVDATFLAMAGLKRSNINSDNIKPIDVSYMLPAVAQGAIVVQCKKQNNEIKNILKKINHEESFLATKIERAFLYEFEGSCKTPIAALANIKDNMVNFNCLIAKFDGSKILKFIDNVKLEDAENLAKKAASDLKTKAGDNFFEN